MSPTEILDEIDALDADDRAYLFGELWAERPDELREARR